MLPSLMTDMQIDEAWDMYLAYLGNQAERGYRLCDGCQQWYNVRHMRQYAGGWLCTCCASKYDPTIAPEDTHPPVAQICGYCGDAHDSLTAKLDGVDCCESCMQIVIDASTPC
ncbi:MAG TPA: hypothetical protein PKL11_06320 [Anaerolineaceae bacterium]|nr:hypothetical protein [Anaerolineaceae bacterium]